MNFKSPMHAQGQRHLSMKHITPAHWVIWYPCVEGKSCFARQRRSLIQTLYISISFFAVILNSHEVPPLVVMNTLVEPALATPTKIRGVADPDVPDDLSKVTQAMPISRVCGYRKNNGKYSAPTISLLYPVVSVGSGI